MAEKPAASAATKGSYSIIRYHNTGTEEDLNIGLVVVSGERSKIRTSNFGKIRAANIFGVDPELMHVYSEAVRRRLVQLSQEGNLTEATLADFVNTRANQIRMTPPRYMRINDFEFDFNRLWDRVLPFYKA